MDDLDLRALSGSDFADLADRVKRERERRSRLVVWDETMVIRYADRDWFCNGRILVRADLTEGLEVEDQPLKIVEPESIDYLVASFAAGASDPYIRAVYLPVLRLGTVVPGPDVWDLVAVWRDGEIVAVVMPAVVRETEDRRGWTPKRRERTPGALVSELVERGEVTRG